VVPPRNVWLLVAVWSVPALLTMLQPSLNGGFSGIGPALAREGVPWVIWIPMTPVILRRAAMPGTLRGKSLAGHVAMAFGISIGFGLINGMFYYVLRRPFDPQTIPASLWMGVVDWLPFQPLVYAGVLAAGIAIDAGKRRRDAELARAQLEAQLATSQLAALRAQLHPHFLFNTLNAAVALARAGDSAATVRVLVLLGDLLRQLLQRDAPHEVPLREELALLEIYVEIQRVRFGDRLRVRWEIDDAVRDAPVPQLVLQPLVENALQHGIAPRTRAGRLEITAERRGDQLRLAVSDDGPGLAPDFSLAETTGVGLRNTRERLRRLYGDRGELVLTTAGELTTAVIELPLPAAAGAAAAAVEVAGG
jgi:signal transduction histidine kinase